VVSVSFSLDGRVIEPFVSLSEPELDVLDFFFDVDDELELESLSIVLALDFAISVTVVHWPARLAAVALDDAVTEAPLQVSVTWSPALKLASFEAALVSTGSVTLSDVVVDAALLLALSRTVIVLALESAETTTASTLADFPEVLDEEL